MLARGRKGDMEYILICFVALAASLLTFFSGFGLGTLLLPAFVLFFPVAVAVSMTAVVHFANNLFKLSLVGRHADKDAVLRFGLPGAIAAFGGAFLLLHLAEQAPLHEWRLWGRAHQITPVNLTIGSLLILFAAAEALPRFARSTLGRRWMPVGGVLSGFIGGLSGHQGALRSAFLVKAGLSKEAFIGTGAMIATLVDVSRLFVYGWGLPGAQLRANAPLLIAAVLAAFTGAIVGRRLLPKMRFRSIQIVVGALLALVGAGLATGVI